MHVYLRNNRLAWRSLAVIVLALSAVLATAQSGSGSAADDETRPFAAPAAATAAAQALVSKLCAPAPPAAWPGFRKIPGFITITGNGYWITPFDFQGTRMVFLLSYPGENYKQCRVSDFVVLPTASAGQSFLQCTLDNDDSTGFGIRQGAGRPVVYWSVDAQNHRLRRVPLHVLGDPKPSCHQPETGD